MKQFHNKILMGLMALCLLFLGKKAQAQQPFVEPSWYNYSDTVYYPGSPTNPNRWRVFLHIPRRAAGNIRGLVMASLTIDEEAFFRSDSIRKVAEEEQLALVYFQCLSNFAANDVAANIDMDTTYLLKALDRLATISGYKEIKNAPWLTYGHSTSGAFVRKLVFWKPERSFGAICYKSGAFSKPKWCNKSLHEVPVLAVDGQYEEYGPNGGPNPPRNGPYNYWAQVDSMLLLRHDSLPHRTSAIVCAGEGHFDYTERVDGFLAKFIKKAAQYRIPYDRFATDSVLTLNSIPMHQGWLADTAVFTNPNINVASFADYAATGADTNNAFWFMDQELAQDWKTLVANTELTKTRDTVNFTVGNFNDANGLSYSYTAKMGWVLLPTVTKSGLPVKLRVAQGCANSNANFGSDSVYLSATKASVWGAAWIGARTTGDATRALADRIMLLRSQARTGNSNFLSIDTTGLGVPKAGTIFTLRPSLTSNLQPEYYILSGPGRILGNNQIEVLHYPNHVGRNYIRLLVGHPGDGNYATSNIVQLDIPVSDTVTTVNVKPLHKQSPFVIYPNPGNGIFRVNNAASIQGISVYNALGAKLEGNIGNQGTEKVIDLSNQAPGLYLVNISSPEGRFVQRIVLR